MSYGLFDVLALQGVTLPSTNVSSEVTTGFEVKEARDAAYVEITQATFYTSAYLSLVLGNGTREVTAAQAKTLPGVTGGETITVLCEIYIDSLDENQDAALQIDFFDEDGVQQGSTEELSVTEAGTWEAKSGTVEVPEDATRMNVYCRATCGAAETVKAWFAHLRITR